MNILFTNYKGGTGKSSLSFNLSAFTGYRYITNDTTVPNDPDIIQIAPRLKRIPKELQFPDCTIYDFGAMSTQLDPKVSHALKLCDLVVIPTLTDQRSLQATIDTVRLILPSGKPFVVIINNFTQKKKYQRAQMRLREVLGEIPIYGIRHTTLFEWVAEYGREWLITVNHQKGVARLLKTKEQHEKIYRSILQHGAKHAAANTG